MLAALRNGHVAMAFRIVFEKAMAVVRRRNGAWRVDLPSTGDPPQCLAVDPLQPSHPLLWHRQWGSPGRAAMQVPRGRRSTRASHTKRTSRR
jgi:hypothetical protein